MSKNKKGYQFLTNYWDKKHKDFERGQNEETEMVNKEFDDLDNRSFDVFNAGMRN